MIMVARNKTGMGRLQMSELTSAFRTIEDNGYTLAKTVEPIVQEVEPAKPILEPEEAAPITPVFTSEPEPFIPEKTPDPGTKPFSM